MKHSKAAAKRLAEANRKAIEDPAPLPAELQDTLDNYRPRLISQTTWARVAATHRAVMLRTSLQGRPTFIGRCGDLAAYLGWRSESGLSIDLEDAMTYAAIDDYHRRGDRTGINPTNWDNRYSRLRTLARQSNPGLDAPPAAATAGYRAIRAPYDDREVATIVRVAFGQRKPVIRRQLCFIVGAGLGAGLGSPDLRHLRGECVTDFGDEGIRVDVIGDRPRTIWVRERYEDLVRIGLEGVRPGGLVVGTKERRRNVTTGVIASAELYGSDTPDIDVARLRSTWCAWLLTQPIPLTTALEVAGLTTARSFQDLIPYIQSPPASPIELRGRTRTTEEN